MKTSILGQKMKGETMMQGKNQSQLIIVKKIVNHDNEREREREKNFFIMFSQEEDKKVS